MKSVEPSVGVFWGVADGKNVYRLIAEHVFLARAEVYGDCLTFEPGHSETWDHLRRQQVLPIAVRNREYDQIPRGRVVYHQPTVTIWLYADRRLQIPSFIREVVREFRLIDQRVIVKSDEHYS